AVQPDASRNLECGHGASDLLRLLVLREKNAFLPTLGQDSRSLVLDDADRRFWNHHAPTEREPCLTDGFFSKSRLPSSRNSLLALPHSGLRLPRPDTSPNSSEENQQTSSATSAPCARLSRRSGRRWFLSSSTTAALIAATWPHLTYITSRT